MRAGSASVGAAVGSLAGPGGAAIGAAGGVVAVELLEQDAPEVIIDSPASTIHETTSLVETVGLWYLLLFVLLPFLTKRGRGWVKKFTQLHDSVSQEELKKLEEQIQSLQKE